MDNREREIEIGDDDVMDLFDTYLVKYPKRKTTKGLANEARQHHR